MEQQREYTQKVCREGDEEFGLPLCIIPKQPISVNLSRPALKNVYMLEFHPSLAVASKIPEALKYALQVSDTSWLGVQCCWNILENF